jgi:hypothetical protein
LVWKADSTVKRIAHKCGGATSISNRLTSNTALGVREGRTRGGRRCWWETIVELRPEGPVQRGTIYLGAVDERLGGSGHFDGELENIVRDKSFDVVVPRANIREHYEMRDGVFFGPEESQLKC